MLRYSSKSLQSSLLPVWEFCYRVCPLYLWTTVFGYPASGYEARNEKANKKQNEPVPRCLEDYQYLGEDGDENYENDVDALAHQVLEFLSTMLSVPAVHSVLRYSLYHLVSCLYHFALLTEFDLRNWRNNPMHFMPSSHSNE